MRLRPPAIIVVLALLIGGVWGTRLVVGQSADAESLARRQAAMDTLTTILGPTPAKFRGRLNAFDKTWEEWQARTGELPPDFDAMPSMADLPDPLVPLGHPGAARITTPGQWRRQRDAIRAGFEHWVYGTMPPAPDNLTGRIVASTREGDVTVEDVLLEFGPERRATLRVQLLVPPGPGPFPVFLTNHPRRRPWVNTAVRRGYIGCIVSAIDSSYDDLGPEVRDDSDAWIDIYPESDFSMIARWAWAAMRAVDYLVTRTDVNAKQIGITGHSRNSKSALLAAAFDERIAAVVPSRGNNGDQIPWRFASDVYLSESLSELTSGIPNWFHPRLRFFTGREHKLPIDQNLLVSLVAPRGFLFSHAFTEHQGNVLGVEASYRSVKPVWRFLGREGNLGLYQQPGEHAAAVEDIEVYLDFFDAVFGRKKIPVPEMWVRNYTYDRWRQLSGESVDPTRYPVRRTGDFMPETPGAVIDSAAAWRVQRASIQERLRWALGEEPAGVLLPMGRDLREGYTIDEGHLGALLPRPAQGMRARGVGFGDNLRAEIYLPDGFEVPRAATANSAPPAAAKRLPVVIWLHPYSYATGYSRYAMWAPLVRRGFLVMAFDQIGFGSRATQALRFYERYPHWSLLGKMVADVRSAVTSLSAMNSVDPSQIYLMGYGLGGKLAVVAAALDERVSGTVAISGFAPLRLDTPAKGTEGIGHYSDVHGLLPRFGFFKGHLDRLPIDFDEILAAIAPRPVWIGASVLDRFNPVDDVRRAAAEARRAYSLLGAGDAIHVETPIDFSALPDASMRQASAWLKNLADQTTAASPERKH
jgi:dienelactone hydrolase